MSRRFEVSLRDQPVGRLTETADGGAEFRFLESYRELLPRPVLGQKLEDDLDRVYRSRRGQRLPDFFANLVPEGRLRDVIEAAAGLEAGDDLGLLAFVGRDLPGAVVVREVDEEGAPASTAIVSQDDEGDDTPPASEGLRFSLAGVQLKFSMLRDEDKLTLPARNRGGEWIVKLDSPTFPRLTENELSMLEWARRAGFEVPECHLHDADDLLGLPRRYAPPGSRALAIRRFDRTPNVTNLQGRIHQEDFAQAVGLPPKKKYDQITYEKMAVLVRSFVDEAAVDELVRRLVFVIACGNNDAHLKNWTFVYPDTIRASWSPLYDQVATIAWETPDRALALKLAGVKEFHQIERSTFERFADRAAVDRTRVARLVDETLERLRQAWREHGSEFPLPPSHTAALCAHWRRVPLLRDAGELESA